MYILKGDGSSGIIIMDYKGKFEVFRRHVWGLLSDCGMTHKPSKVTVAENDVRHDATETLDTRKFETHSFVGTSVGFLSNHGTRAPKVTTVENHVERGAETA